MKLLILQLTIVCRNRNTITFHCDLVFMIDTTDLIKLFTICRNNIRKTIIAKWEFHRIKNLMAQTITEIFRFFRMTRAFSSITDRLDFFVLVNGKNSIGKRGREKENGKLAF